MPDSSVYLLEAILSGQMQSTTTLFSVLSHPCAYNAKLGFTGFFTLIAFVFQDDGYIPKHSVLELQKAWPGSEVRWVTGGHVSSFLLHNGEFRRAIVDGLGRLEWKESPL